MLCYAESLYIILQRKKYVKHFSAKFSKIFEYFLQAKTTKFCTNGNVCTLQHASFCKRCHLANTVKQFAQSKTPCCLESWRNFARPVFVCKTTSFARQLQSVLLNESFDNSHLIAKTATPKVYTTNKPLHSTWKFAPLPRIKRG